MALYDYTLTPIAAGITPAEYEQAQLELFEQGNKLSLKVMIILAAVAAIGLFGVFYFKGGASVFFWLLLIGVALFLLVKFIGLKWYMKRQLAKQDIPDELHGLKLGLQPHGLIISLPNTMAAKMMPKANKSMMTMLKSKQMGGDITWKSMNEYKETPNFYVVMFDVKGQQGSQIIPKRLKNKNFPIENLAKLLNENVEKT